MMPRRTATNVSSKHNHPRQQAVVFFLMAIASNLSSLGIGFHLGSSNWFGTSHSHSKNYNCPSGAGVDQEDFVGDRHVMNPDAPTRKFEILKGEVTSRSTAAVAAADAATTAFRVPTRQFFQTFDTGTPWDETDDVWIVFPNSAAATTEEFHQHPQQPALLIDHIRSSCDIVKVVLTREIPNIQTCIAISKQQRNEAYHVFKFTKGPAKNGSTWKSVGRYSGTKAALQHPPKPVTVRENMDLLTQYWKLHQQALKELKPMADKLVLAGSRDERVYIVVLVCNAGHAELLLNFYCAATRIGVDVARGNFLLFATDSETKALGDSLAIPTFYFAPLFASIPSNGTIEYGTLPYAHVMLSKVYCMHLMMSSSLGNVDVFFQDVDIVPYRKDYLDHFVQYAKSSAIDHYDMYFQYDHSTAPLYLPWSANSGFYYVKNNAKTRHFFESLLRNGDMILRTKSHQAVLIALLSEHASMFGLRVKVMHEQSREYPGMFVLEEGDGRGIA
jgi:Nucleotide-diphospho-sugar transferase